MGPEQLLFLLILVGIPLVELLIRAMRARTGGSQRERDPAAGGATPPPALPQPIRPAAFEQAGVPPREARVRRDDQPRPPADRRPRRSEQPMRPGTAIRGGLARGDLRRAVVLMVILGPCRALEPKDPSQVG